MLFLRVFVFCMFLLYCCWYYNYSGRCFPSGAVVFTQLAAVNLVEIRRDHREKK